MPTAASERRLVACGLGDGGPDSRVQELIDASVVAVPLLAFRACRVDDRPDGIPVRFDMVRAGQARALAWAGDAKASTAPAASASAARRRVILWVRNAMLFVSLLHDRPLGPKAVRDGSSLSITFDRTHPLTLGEVESLTIAGRDAYLHPDVDTPLCFVALMGQDYPGPDGFGYSEILMVEITNDQPDGLCDQARQMAEPIAAPMPS